MWWVVGYFVIGWLWLCVGVWQSKTTALPVAVSVALFMFWPGALYMACKQLRDDKGEER